MRRRRGWDARLFKGLVPILMKQVPYTVVQLTTFQLTTDVAYNRFLPHVTGKTKDELPLAYVHRERAPVAYEHRERGDWRLTGIACVGSSCRRRWQVVLLRAQCRRWHRIRPTRS